MKEIKILIADNQWIVREGIKSVLERHADLHIIGEVCNRTELRDALRANTPDVILLDCLQPEGFSPGIIPFINQSSPASGVLVVSSNDHKADLLVTLEYGVQGLIFKECKEAEFVEAIRAIAGGEKFFCSKVLHMTVEQKSDENKTGQLSDLSIREMEIASLIVQGHANKVIADKLMISVHTVSTHRKNIFRKLGVNSVSELILYAVKKGIIVNQQV